MAGQTVRVRMKFGEREFEAEGPAAFVADMLKHFETSKPGAAAGTHATVSVGKEKEKSTNAVISTKAMSLTEFVRSAGVAKHTDLVLAFGYYLEKHKGVAEFSPADINACYYETRREPSNTSQAIIYNVKSGRIMAAKNEGAGRSKYVVTSSGEEEVSGWLAASAD